MIFFHLASKSIAADFLLGGVSLIPMRFSALFTDYNLLCNDKRKNFFDVLLNKMPLRRGLCSNPCGTNDIGGFPRGIFQSLSRQLFGEPGESR